MVGGFLASISHTITFFLASFGMLLYSLLLAFYAGETLPQKSSTSENYYKSFTGYVHVLRDSRFLPFIGAFILAQMCALMIWILMPVYANEIFNVPERHYGFIPATNALMVVFLQIYITQITKRHRPLPVMMAGTFFYTIGVGSVAFGQSFIGFWISIVIMTIGELILMPTASAYVAELAPVEMRGRYMSVAGLTWSAAAGIAPILGGFLNDNVSTVAPWYGGFVIGVIGMLAFFYLLRKDSKVHSSAYLN
jgi:MFS family permease